MLKRVVVVALVLAVASCGWSRILRGSADGAKAEVSDARGSRCPSALGPNEMSAIEQAVGENLTFVVVELDNTGGGRQFEWLPGLDSAALLDGRGDAYTHFDVRYKLIGLGISDAAKDLFDTAQVPVGSTRTFVIAFSGKAKMTSAKRFAISRFGSLVLGCE